MEKLDIFKSSSEIAKRFPTVGKGFNTQLEAKGNEQPTSKTFLDGYVLRCPPPLSRIIQARRGSFSFHKINGYENFEILIKELYEHWDILVQSVGSLTVNNLSVRYLNFIVINPGEEINDILTIHTTHPFGKAIESNFLQYKFKYDANPEIDTTVITAKGNEGTQSGIVLDIILNKKIRDEQNKDAFFSYFFDMRKAKNDLFFRSITENTIIKYNQ